VSTETLAVIGVLTGVVDALKGVLSLARQAIAHRRLLSVTAWRSQTHAHSVGA
jgi:hypothetical protein